jgi:pimeloyl-ACP methyl ester carboxylesterase
VAGENRDEVDFSQITVPVEFWHGEEDRNIPFAMVKDYASSIPSARTRYFPGEGHYSIIARSNEGVRESLSREKSPEFRAAL